MQRLILAIAGACLLLGAVCGPASGHVRTDDVPPANSYRQAVESAQAVMMASPQEALERARTAEALRSPSSLARHLRTW